jgi:NAD(P)H-hydrate epimerase
MKVLNCAQSKTLEKSAVEAGIGYLQLMENAGASAVRFLSEKFSLAQKHVVVLCGKGNNGGDGYVAARYLSELGALAVAILVEGPPATDISKIMYSRMSGASVKALNYDDNMDAILPVLTTADYIIDAIYGTGFHGAVSQKLSPVFNAVKQTSAMLVSLDMPSGANCDSGAVEGNCIRADYTITFSTLKYGHFIQPAQNFCGQVVVAPIGIDAKLIAGQDSVLTVTEPDEVKAMLNPRNPESNKGDYGRLLCVCGSEGMAGAAVMSARAAIRCGAGIVNVALPRSIYGIVASHAVEPVFTLLDLCNNGELEPTSNTALLTALSKASACLIGCGLGKSEAATAMLFDMLANARIPLIIDADGINILAENINRLKTVIVPVVLTPHPGEMARLMKTTVQDVQSHRLEYARRFAMEYNVILVLKGAGTVIAEPNGMLHLNMTGNAGMAKGGSGDVLAGMVASFIAQGIEPAKAAAGAVYFHGAAGDRCAKEFSQCAMLPTDIIDMLPKLFLEIER